VPRDLIGCMMMPSGKRQNLTLLGGARRFTGPLPGPTKPGNAHMATDCLQYFRQYWLAEVLDRIVLETNR
jgi:hypothetical protein